MVLAPQLLFLNAIYFIHKKKKKKLTHQIFIEELIAIWIIFFLEESMKWFAILSLDDSLTIYYKLVENVQLMLYIID